MRELPMRSLRFLLAAAVGFVAATLFYIPLALLVGSSVDPEVRAGLGALHIALWVFITWWSYRGLARRRAKRLASAASAPDAQPHERPVPPKGLSNASHGANGTADQARVEHEPVAAASAEVPAALRAAYGRPGLRHFALAAGAIVVVFAVSAAGGFFGARVAADSATTTTEAVTTTTVVASFDDLTDTEKVWCRSSDTVLVAAHTLGYWDFAVGPVENISEEWLDAYVWHLDNTVSICDQRGPGMVCQEPPYINYATDAVLDEWLQWSETDDYELQFALACRAAFQAR